MAEKMAHSSDQTPTPQQSNPPVATAGTSANIITAATKWIKKTTKNLASLKSQSKQFIAPNGKQINTFPKFVKVTYRIALSNFNKIDSSTFLIEFGLLDPVWNHSMTSGASARSIWMNSKPCTLRMSRVSADSESWSKKPLRSQNRELPGPKKVAVSLRSRLSGPKREFN